ncbi:hypothetical protein [Pseudonocardia sp. NPDC046786]|uniref:hypothetical protein n=1 Tax=Pseudonocardia sp. NPDC046786 TaxID=3155471 RepID=UPI0033E07450
MRKSVRGAIVGAALLPLAVAGPGMAFAGSTGYEESSGKDHSKHEDHGKGHHGKGHGKDGDHEHGHHKHDKKHKHEHGHEKDEKKESPVPEPLAGVLELITGATGGEMAAGPVG